MLKYGGTSLATPARITEAARKIAKRAEAGHELIVVVSAMGHSTDELLQEAFRVNEDPPIRELDMLLTAGERISMALMAMALQALGREAISFTGSQSGIITDALHTRARIIDVRGTRIREELERGRIVIVAGFQGVSSHREVTTLGRGGSDTTAVALAAAFHAERCEIFTDVAGVYTADPRVEPRAWLISQVSYDEAAEMAALGTGVVHVRCVEIARTYGLPIRVASSFAEGSGTMIQELDRTAEVPVRGISHERGLARVIWDDIPQPTEAARILDAAGQKGVVTRMVIQQLGEGGRMALSLVCPREYLGKLLAIARSVGAESERNALGSQDGLASVSVIGHGITSAPEAVSRLLRVLSQEGIHPELVISTALSVTCLVEEETVERAVRALHKELVPTAPPRDGAPLPGG